MAHWNRFRDPRRGLFTEQTELKGLDAALSSIEHIVPCADVLLKKDISLVTYIACDTTWSNVMTETIPTIPKVGYRCREAIVEQLVHPMCPVSTWSTLENSMTKKG